MREFREAIEGLYLASVIAFNAAMYAIGLLVLPYFVWLHYERQNAKIAEMASFAKKNGFRFKHGIHRSMHREHRFLHKVSGSRQYGLNIMTGEFEGHSVTMFDYHFQRYFKCKSWEFSKYIEHNYISFFVLDLEKQFPVLKIAKEEPKSKVLARLADAIGRGDIDFESHEFSERFDVRSDDRKFAYDFCNARMMEFLLEGPARPINVEKQKLVISTDSALSMKNIERNVDFLLNIRKRMPDYLFA